MTDTEIKPAQNTRYLLIDTEASGFHPHKHGLLEVAALALDDQLNVIKQYQSYINPPADVMYNEQAMKLNGITKESIASGLSYKDFCDSFLDFIKSNFKAKPIVIAQFYPFDGAYLNYVFEYCGHDRLLIETLGNDFVDTKSMVNEANMKARRAGKPLPFPVTSLSNPGGLKEVLNIQENGHRAHTAIGDVLATRDVLLKLLEVLQ